MQQTIQQIIEHLKDAKRQNDQMQEQYAVGSAQWNAHETIDDKLHEALTLLGD